MKKTLLLVAALITFSFYSFAQCGPYVNTSKLRIARDTTWVKLWVDSSWGTSSSYNWKLADGIVRPGFSVICPVTDVVTGQSIYTLSGTGCYETEVGYSYTVSVFNCDSLAARVRLSEPEAILGANIDSISVFTSLDPWNGYSYDTSFRANIHHDWGNGNVRHKTVRINDGVFFAGPSDGANRPNYRYGGEYIIRDTFNFFVDTITCPLIVAQPYAYRMPGTNTPAISGSVTYCAGDTLRLTAYDTTMFHNMHHMISPSMSGYMWNTSPYYSWTDFWLWFDGSETIYNGRPSQFIYTWTDKYLNPIGSDTMLVLPNLDSFLSGPIYLRTVDRIGGGQSFVSIDISVNGPTISMDSAVSAPGCADTAKLCIRTNRINDSVHFTYLKDGAIQHAYGRTNATGRIVMRNLSAGHYSEIQAHFIGTPCASNKLGKFILNKTETPLITFSSQVICTGGSASLVISSPITGAVYTWISSSAIISTGNARIVTSATSADGGYYSVSASIPGCLPSDTVAFGSLGVLSAPVSRYYRETICEGKHVRIGGLSDLISTPDSNIVSTAGIARHAGTVIVSSVYTNACGSAILYDTVTVLEAPVLAPITGPASLCGNDTATFTTTSFGGTWLYTSSGLQLIGAALSSSIRLTSYGPAGPGYITYRKINAVGCTTTVSKDISIGGPVPYVAENMYLGAFIGDTIAVAAQVGAGYPIYTALPAVWSATPSSLLSVVSPTNIAAAEHTGRGTITGIGSNTCGIRTANAQTVVTDWLTTDLTAKNWNEMEPHTLAELYDVSDAARDTAGNTWLLSNDVLFMVDKYGRINRVAGQLHNPGDSIANVYSGDGGPAANALLTGARRVFCDYAGNVYIVCDREVIRKIDVNGIITRFAGVDRSPENLPFRFGYTGDGGPATNAKIYVNNATFDRNGNVYFTDLIHNVVRKINTAGIISTFAGTGSPGFSGDGGPATLAQLGRPIGIAADTAGNIIVSSCGRLRKINTAGIITTIAGTDGGTLNDTTALQTARVFDGPVSIDKTGNIFSGTHYIRRIDHYGNVTTTSDLLSYDPVYFSHGIDSNGNYLVYYYYGNPVNHGYMNYKTGWYDGCNIIPDDSGAVYTVSGGVYKKYGKPSVEIHASVDSNCGTTPVLFTAQGHNTGNTPSYTWRKNGVVVATDTLRYYDAAYTIGDTVTCTLLRWAGGRPLDTGLDNTVVDTSAPVITTIVLAPSSLCPGTSASLSGMPTGGVWQSSSLSVATVAGNTVTGVASGVALVSYTITNACGSISDTQSTMVLPAADAGTISGDTSLCISSGILLTSVVPGGSWYVSSGAAAITSAGMVTGIHTGADTALYVVTTTCGSDTAMHNIEVLTVPVPGFIIGNDTLCQGETATLTETSPSGIWSSVDPAVATVSASGSVTATTPGTTTINYMVSNACGTTTDTVLLTVNTLPDAGTISGSTALCVGVETSLSASVGGGMWSSAGGMVSVSGTGGAIPTHVGADTIVYTVVNNCGAATAILPVEINTLPDAAEVTGADTICEGETTVLTVATGPGTWHSDNTSVATVAASGSVYAATAGETFISYSIANMCGVSLFSHYLYVRPLADCSPITSSAFNIYPNPSTGTFTVELPAPVSNATITIADVSGKVITTLTTSQPSTLVDMSAYPSATYILTITNNGITYHNKVVLW